MSNNIGFGIYYKPFLRQLKKIILDADMKT